MAHIINVAIKLFDNMRYYNIRNFWSIGTYRNPMKKTQITSIRKLPLEDCVKINANASERHSTRLASKGYVISNNHATIIMVKGKQTEDWPILVAECLDVEEASMMALQENIRRVIIQSDSQFVLNSINDKLCVPKEIINLCKI